MTRTERDRRRPSHWQGLLDRAAALEAENARLQDILGAAILVVVAYRLRDEDALILAMNRLVESFDAFEAKAGQEAHEDLPS